MFPVDQDQALLWQTALDYASGVFREPRFYGQDYNTALEALLSVPLVRCGVPVYFAVPIITAVLFLVPDALLSAPQA